ncbi:hypothetical protein J3R82DRAFT_6229, partial [Butyriboletus roseoflavus]
ILLSRAPSRFALLGLLATLSGVFAQNTNTTTLRHTTVLILGGGLTGVIAARNLHEQGIDNFIILDAKTELGGRMSPKPFGVAGGQVVVELGPNWVQGTQQGDGPVNPIWTSALKHNLSIVYNDLYGNVSVCILLPFRNVCSWVLATYDGSVYNYTDVFNNVVDNFAQATVVAASRLEEGEVDLSLRSAYGLMGISPKTPQEDASDCYQIDWVSNTCL